MAGAIIVHRSAGFEHRVANVKRADVSSCHGRPVAIVAAATVLFSFRSQSVGALQLATFAHSASLRPHCLGRGRLQAIPEDSGEELQLAREFLSRQFGAEGSESGTAISPVGDWTVQTAELGEDGLPSVGTVLCANPTPFFSDAAPFPAATLRTGLRPARADAPRRDLGRLPVVLVTKVSRGGAEGLLLGVWSGKLLGDLDLQEFMTRPLYWGGISIVDPEKLLTMLHAYPDMPGAVKVTEDGLAVSNSFETAREWITEGPGSSLRFKFFQGCVRWDDDEVQELSPEAGIWLAVNASRNVLLREPDSSFEEPLWVQLAEKAGGKLAALGAEHGLLPT
eukprot:TRINITY_DN23866_c0_g1_i1.p1 TRINITY_DN23866_c0_g1~~TRINITY_DN23866_c0_g1_i1.p1  ORF type:complete len:348 (+),score=56.72 TRINITY_DN23866_c0_g1_i1:34-1044(+)